MIYIPFNNIIQACMIGDINFLKTIDITMCNNDDIDQLYNIAIHYGMVNVLKYLVDSYERYYYSSYFDTIESINTIIRHNNISNINMIFDIYKKINQDIFIIKP